MQSVDDGFTDETKERLKQLEGFPSVKIFSFDQNRGKTFAVKFGIEQARGDFIVIQDADLEYSPEFYPQLLAPLLNNQAEVVYGSRFMGRIKNMAFINWLANKISKLTINTLFNARLTDFRTCFKMFQRDVIKDLPIKSKNFVFDTEITARLLRRGYKIYEIPIDYIARSKKEGKKITWGKALEAYFFLLRYRFARPKDQ